MTKNAHLDLRMTTGDDVETPLMQEYSDRKRELHDQGVTGDEYKEAIKQVIKEIIQDHGLVSGDIVKEEIGNFANGFEYMYWLRNDQTAYVELLHFNSTLKVILRFASEEECKKAEPMYEAIVPWETNICKESGYPKLEADIKTEDQYIELGADALDGTWMGDL